MHDQPPNRILIIGSGAFGLATAHALSRRHDYNKTKITLLAPSFPSSPKNKSAQSSTSESASLDNTRIVRADYADPQYAALAESAQDLWRGEWGAEGRYSESGLVLTADAENESYVQQALTNVLASKVVVEKGSRHIIELKDVAATKAALRVGGARGSGKRGYLNARSGWADAGASMAWLQKQTRALGRVKFVQDTAVRLSYDKTSNAVVGAELANGENLHADLTILATGAWTGQFLDLRGIASARGQCMAYLPLNKDEDAAMQQLPVHFNMTLGTFFFPPAQGEIKVARHAYGYSNPTPIDSTPLSQSRNSTDTASPSRISLPSFPSAIPPSDQTILLNFLSACLPSLSESITRKQQNNQIRSRMCWYLDTHSGDWLVCKPSGPQYPSKGLFLATGGSGHAFKFLPVLGERVVDVMLDVFKGDGNDMWTRKWAWPEKIAEDEVWCNDASRAGNIGETLSDALAKRDSKSKL